MGGVTVAAEDQQCRAGTGCDHLAFNPASAPDLPGWAAQPRRGGGQQPVSRRGGFPFDALFWVWAGVAAAQQGHVGAGHGRGGAGVADVEQDQVPGHQAGAASLGSPPVRGRRAKGFRRNRKRQVPVDAARPSVQLGGHCSAVASPWSRGRLTPPSGEA